MISQVH